MGRSDLPWMRAGRAPVTAGSDGATSLITWQWIGRAVGWGGPEPEMREELLNDLGLLDKGDDPHGSVAAGTHQRVHLVESLRPRDHLCSRSGGG